MYARAPRAAGTAAPRLRLQTVLAPPDPWIFATVAGLIAIGLVMVFSASSATAYAEHHDTAYFLKRQLVWLAIGSVFAYLAYRVDYTKLKRISPAIVGVTVLLLMLTLIPHIGLQTGGARRWLGTNALSFQPSEIAKLALVLFMAAKLSTIGADVRSLVRGVVPTLLVAAVIAVPILLEPDMGTASIVMFTAFGMLFCAGARFEHLALTVLALLPPVAIAVGASAYKRARILAFIDPWKDAQNTGFHIVQSLLALGSGGIFGLGLGASRQKFFYLPEAHTDFIFAVIGEELGFLGSMIVLSLFAAFAIRAFVLAQRTTDRFGFFLIVGCALLIVIQAFINIGVVSSSWPVTGVPLPFISFGGTSLIVSLVAVALIMNVARRAR
ncbi:MAG TPA: putative lipid II flippase FtsW [Candidatus Lustribacter sp.]